MQPLAPQELRGFAERFCHFHDAVLVEVHLALGNPKSATLRFHAMDETKDRTWVDLLLRVDGLETFLWKEDWQDLRNLVVTFPLVASYINGMYYVGVQVHGNGDLYTTPRMFIDEAALLLVGQRLYYVVSALPRGEP